MKKIIVTVLMVLGLAACSNFATGMSVEGNEVLIPIKAVNDGKAHFYSIDADGKEVRFFVLKSSDGVMRAALDACDICYKAGKGYSQDGEYMVCDNCGLKFHSNKINDVKGGCNPVPVNRVERDGQVVLSLNELKSNASYF